MCCMHKYIDRSIYEQLCVALIGFIIQMHCSLPLYSNIYDVYVYVYTGLVL